jgi:hypothetical protein
MENSLSRYKSSLYSIIKIVFASMLGIWLASIASNALLEASRSSPSLSRTTFEIITGVVAAVIGIVISARTIKPLLNERLTPSLVLVDIGGAVLLVFGVMLALYGLTSMGIP